MINVQKVKKGLGKCWKFFAAKPAFADIYMPKQQQDVLKNFVNQFNNISAEAFLDPNSTNPIVSSLSDGERVLAAMGNSEKFRLTMLRQSCLNVIASLTKELRMCGLFDFSKKREIKEK